MTLVELLLAMSLASILVLTLLGINSINFKAYRDIRSGWLCMQSLRSALAQIDADLAQCACLLPPDMKAAYQGGTLFISGVPATSSHRGLSVHHRVPPPYFSIVQDVSGSSITLDAVDIDQDGQDDYWANLGVITESGPHVITGSYSRGSRVLTLTSLARSSAGERAVPSVNYMVKEDGLYRNNQLLAEAVCSLEATVSPSKVTVTLKACCHGKEKILSYTHPLY